MSTSGQDEPKHQSFYGPASFGGDNKGIINNVLLDAKTKALVAKMAEYAPPLAGLLERAVRDGVMSPGAVEALLLAARNINEDVAQALLIAGRNINEDVADRLWYAGKNINKEVADQFVNVNQEIGERVRELNGAVDSLRETVRQIRGVQGKGFPSNRLDPAGTDTGTVSRIAEVPMMPSLRSPDKWRVRFGLICCSSGVGLVAAVILTRSHLGGYAVFAGILMLVGALLLFAKMRR